MTSIRVGALLAPLLLCGFAPQDVQSTNAYPSTTYVVQCEVWNATDPDLVRLIEALPSAQAESVLQTLQGTEQGTERLARVLAPILLGSEATFESELEIPTTTITASAGGRTQQHFSGYTSQGTTVVLGCMAGPSTNVVTSVSLSVTTHQKEQGAKSNPAVPPRRRSIKLQCSETSAPGELSMIQFQTSEPGILVVFLRATAR